MSAPPQFYEKIRKVGEGAHSIVYEGKFKLTGKTFAIKQMKRRFEGDHPDMSHLRELAVMQQLRHPNIVDYYDVFIEEKNLCLVFGLYDLNLELMIKDKSVVLEPGDVKAWMMMLLRGLEYCHQRKILHRDLKPDNILMDSATGQLKIADFGTAGPFDPKGPMTPHLGARWYRAPEVMFGEKFYTGAVDVWAAGCIFAELMLRDNFLKSDTNIAQITAIFKALGTPTEAQWPGMKNLPDYVEFPAFPKPPLASIIDNASPDALDLLEKMLTLDPAKRITASEALQHPYFTVNLPSPTPPEELPKKAAPIPNLADLIWSEGYEPAHVHFGDDGNFYMIF